MNFKIDEEIFNKFEGLNIGVVVCKGVNNGISDGDIHQKLEEEEEKIRSSLSLDTLGEYPKIDVWRKTYTDFGAKPKEHRSSIENLSRLILNGVSLRHINPLVDIYNFISLRYMLPVGGEDLDQVAGDIVLTFAGANEPEVLLLGDKDPRSPHPGEVIYKDNVSAICRRWNWREADRTKLTEQTKNCILVLEGLPPVTMEEVLEATKELKELVERVCGGDISFSVLDKGNPEIFIH